MVNYMLSFLRFSDGFYGEVMLKNCYILNRVLKKEYDNSLRIMVQEETKIGIFESLGCRVVVWLTEPKRKKLGERGINYIFVDYTEHSRTYRFFILEHNDYVSVNPKP